MPRGKLTRNEKYIITGMAADNYSIDEIIEETGRSAQVIGKFLKSLEKENQDKEVPPEEKPMIPRGENKTQFIKHTAVKRDNSVSIMTEGESTRSEVQKPKKKSKIVKRFEPVIHKIRPDEDD